MAKGVVVVWTEAAGRKNTSSMMAYVPPLPDGQTPAPETVLGPGTRTYLLPNDRATAVCRYVGRRAASVNPNYEEFQSNLAEANERSGDGVRATAQG